MIKAKITRRVSDVSWVEGGYDTEVKCNDSQRGSYATVTITGDGNMIRDMLEGRDSSLLTLRDAIAARVW